MLTVFGLLSYSLAVLDNRNCVATGDGEHDADGGDAYVHADVGGVPCHVHTYVCDDGPDGECDAECTVAEAEGPARLGSPQGTAALRFPRAVDWRKEA